MPDIIDSLRFAISEQDAAKVLHIANEIVQQYDEGLIKVLPCKVGDTLYWKLIGGKFSECTVRGIDFTGRYTMIGINVFRDGLQDKEHLDFDGALPLSALGNTLLTRAEAEKALQEVKHGN